MPLLETLILNVAPAIGKAILKRWIKDDIGFSAGSSIIDVLKSVTTDAFARQKGSIQFDSIGTQIAESLLPIFEVEGGPLDEGGRNAVALTLADTLNAAVITPKLLAKHDLDPTQLSRYLKAALPDAAKDYSQAETALYDRLISECSQCIIDISSQLPHFTERTIAEVLRRESNLIAIAEQTLQEVKRIRQISEQFSPEENARRFEEDYRREVVRTLDKLELFGADVSEESKRHRLSIAYVTLSVRQKQIEQGISKLISDDEDWNIVAVDEALQNSRCLLIRGLAGSGKTTLLQWIAVRSASRSFDESFAAWNDTIPFFIRLRQFSGKELPAPEEFVRLIARTIAGTMPLHWVHEHLRRQGKALVLIDGIDEVPEAQRNEVRQWIQSLVASFPARFIVTARPHAVEEGWLRQEEFEDAELQPMELPSINNFIDYWHQAVSEALQNEKDKAELPSLAEHLKSEVKSKKSIRNLATSPLLCAMLCALHRDRHEHIPNDRITLYEACCNLLINRRDIDRGINLNDYPPLTDRQKRWLLEDLAYWMLRNGQAIVPIDAARHHLLPRIANLQTPLTKLSSESVLRLFTERTGIVREPVKGQMDFTHLTFRDFLAAQAALDEGDIGVLVEHANDDRWREVILLAVGLAKGDIAEQIIKSLLERGDANETTRHQLHLLAVACLRAAAECSMDTKIELQKRLEALVPPRSMTEAATLASAGELALPYLGYKREFKVNIAGNCVRALSLMGTEEALGKLQEWTRDVRWGVRKQLCRAWGCFDRSDYIRQVLNRFENLEFERLFTCEDIKDLTFLTELSLIRCMFTNLGGLEQLTKLERLYFSNCQNLKDISVACRLPSLQSFTAFYCTKITNWKPIDQLSRLGELRIWGNTHLNDLQCAGNLLRLTDLSICYCANVSNLTPLRQLDNLETLHLSGCSQINDLSPISHLNNLAILSLNQCTQVKDLNTLVGLSNLRWLNLNGCSQLNDLSPLAHLPNLAYVDTEGLPDELRQQWIRILSQRSAY